MYCKCCNGVNIFGLFCSVLTYVHVNVRIVTTTHLTPYMPSSPPPSSPPPPLLTLLLSPFLLPLTFSILQAKSRLDLSAQTAKQNYQKELDAREEEMDKIRSTMNRRVRSLEAALEEEHSEKQAAVKVRRLHVVWLKNCVQASCAT